jgi:hypothetical protein
VKEPDIRVSCGAIEETTAGMPFFTASSIKGHDLSGDHPLWNPNVQRWSCVHCGRAVMRRFDGPAYGSALTDKCPRIEGDER